MKDFIVYFQPMGMWEKVRKELTLEEIRDLPGTGRLVELEVVREGKLEFVHEYNGIRLFRFSCDYKVPKSLSGIGQAPFQPLMFELLQRKAGLVTCIQSPKKPSRVAVAVLSYSVFRDPFVISPLRFNTLEFRKLLEVVEKHSGRLSQLSLRWIRSEKGVVRKLEVSGDFGKVLNIDMNTILESTKRVSSMGFVIPSFVGGGTLSFRIADWGGGQIYQPSDPQIHEISNLMALLEEAVLK